jgi:hypothetical protein
MKMTGDKIYFKSTLNRRTFVNYLSETMKRIDRISENKWWVDAVPEIDTIGHNISIMQKTGYVPVATFTLSENCWTDNYFIPQKTRQEEFLKKYAGNKTVEDFIGFMKHEAELYSKYKDYYGYVFYVGKKI